MRLILPLLLMPLTAHAELRVVTDIAPIQSLVAQVMEGVGAPDVLVSGVSSPHDFQFSFDQADSVQSADLIIWNGPALTPWLDEALNTLAPNAPQLALLETETWDALERREWEDDHDHGDHEDEEHAVDPHAWVDPLVAIDWVGEIATALIAQDLDNAMIYEENAAEAIEGLRRLDQDIAARLHGLPRSPLMVPHDAYQYFGSRYGVPAIAPISLGDARPPSPSHIAELQTMMRDLGVTCVLNDPQTRVDWVDLVREGSGAKTARVDPMGTTIPTGPDHYAQTLLSMADAYGACLSPN